MSNQEPRDLVSNLAETLGAEHEELNQAKPPRSSPTWSG